MGVPTPAVKLPSDAPPTATPVGAGSPAAAAIREARAKRSADSAPSRGGRLIPPSISTAASGSTGARARRAASTRCCSATVRARTSTANDASAGTVFRVVPATASVGVTVVPTAGSPSAATASTWCASSTEAFTPFSGSRPACAARPFTSTR